MSRAEGVLEGALAAQEDRLMHCVHCGFCLQVCPTYVRLGDEADSPRGRLYLMRALVEGRLDAGSDAFQTHIDRCLGCRACEPVCPSGVEYGFLLERAREAGARAVPPSWSVRWILRVVGSPALLRLALVKARLLRATGLPGFLARLLPGGGILGRARTALAMLSASEGADLGKLAPGGGAEGWGGGGSAEGSSSPRPPRTRDSAGAHSGPATRVGVLEGCVQKGLYRRVNQATVRTLEANGYRVVAVEGQGCCGALHAHAGSLEDARALARKNIAAFEAARVDAVAVNAAGCGAAMKEYEELLAEDPEWAERARVLSQRSKDVSELLLDRGPRGGARVPLTLTYDAPCHLLHAQGVDDAPLRMLGAVPGAEHVPLERADECCGGAGVYGLTHPDLGGWIGGDKVDRIRATEASAVATGNPGCMMQIGAGLRLTGSGVAVLHPVEVLDESYRRAGFYSGPGRGSDGGGA